VESSGKSRIEDRNLSELPVVQLYMRVVVVLQVSCPYRPSRRVIRPARRPLSEIANHPWLVHVVHIVYLVLVWRFRCRCRWCVVVWRFRSRQSEVVIGDSLVDWRFYSIGGYASGDVRRGCNFGFRGRVSGWC
jgi:hypothetical protein